MLDRAQAEIFAGNGGVLVADMAVQRGDDIERRLEPRRRRGLAAVEQDPMRASGLEIGEVVAGARAIEPVIRIQVVQLAFGRAATMALCAGGRQVIGLQRTAAGAARVVTPFERCLS